MKKLLCFCLALAICSVGFSQTTATKYTLVITNVNIIDVTTGKVAEHRLLAISGNTIKAVDDTKQASKYKADQVVDAGGKYAMPGLWDMHVHFRGGDSPHRRQQKPFTPVPCQWHYHCSRMRRGHDALGNGLG